LAERVALSAEPATTLTPSAADCVLRLASCTFCTISCVACDCWSIAPAIAFEISSILCTVCRDALDRGGRGGRGFLDPLDALGDVGGRLRRLAGEVLHLVGDDREAAARPRRRAPPRWWR
jgi:hypothetical protein